MIQPVNNFNKSQNLFLKEIENDILKERNNTRIKDHEIAHAKILGKYTDKIKFEYQADANNIDRIVHGETTFTNDGSKENIKAILDAAKSENQSNQDKFISSYYDKYL